MSGRALIVVVLLCLSGARCARSHSADASPASIRQVSGGSVNDPSPSSEQHARSVSLDQAAPQEAGGPSALENQQVAATDAASPPDAPAAVIRPGTLSILGEFITIDDVLEPLQPELEQIARALSPDLYYQRVTQLVRQELRALITEYLIYHRAKDLITEEMEPNLEDAVDRMERDRINREFRGRETEYTNHLQERGKSREDVRKRLRRIVVVDRYLRDRLLPLVPQPRKRELLDYYHSHMTAYRTPERRELFLIDVPAAAFFERFPPRPEDLPLADQKARNAIEAAARELAEGKTFEEVARTYSRGVNSDKGGAWGFIASPMTGRWEKPYQRFVTLDEGEISEIIEVAHSAPRGQSVTSFFIVKAGRIEPAQVKSFLEAQPKIVDILREERFQKRKVEFLQTEFERAGVGSLEDFGNQIMRAVPEPGAPGRP